MEKLIINPSEVRGLGDIVSPKTSSDFVGYNAYVTSSTDSNYGTVYTSTQSTNYITHMELTFPRSISSSDTSFNVTIKLYDEDDVPVTTPISLDVNGVVYTGTSWSAITVTCDGSSEYYLRAVHVGGANITGASAIGVVYVNDSVDSVEVFSEKSILQSGQTSVLASRVLKDGKPVKGVEVCFYKE